MGGTHPDIWQQDCAQGKNTSSHLLHLLKSCLGFDRYGNLEITGGLKVLKPKITGLIINMSPDKLSYLSDLRKKKAKWIGGSFYRSNPVLSCLSLYSTLCYIFLFYSHLSRLVWLHEQLQCGPRGFLSSPPPPLFLFFPSLCLLSVSRFFCFVPSVNKHGHICISGAVFFCGCLYL